MKDNKKMLDVEITSVASATECTGLMQVSPDNEYEYNSYRELYEMEIPPKIDVGEEK